MSNKQLQKVNVQSLTELNFNNLSNQIDINPQIQIFLSNARKFIHHNLISQALKQLQRAQYQIKILSKVQKKSSIQSLSPKKILSISKQKSIKKAYLQILYTKVSCLISSKEYNKALTYLNKIKDIQQTYKDNIHFLASICLFQRAEYNQALTQINKCNPTNNNQSIEIDHLFYRARIYHKLNEMNKCISDLKQIIFKQPTHIASIRMLIKIYQQQKQYSESISIINLAFLSIDNSIQIKYLRLKKIICQYQNGQYEQALRSICHLQEQGLKDSKLLYYKGRIHQKQSNQQLSILTFNQSISLNTSTHYSQLCLAQLIIHYLMQRDFYQAFSYAKRIHYISAQKHQVIGNLSLISEGLIFLMKRNFQDGFKAMQNVNLNVFHQQEHSQFINKLYTNAKGFALFSLGRHQQALQQYSKAIDNSINHKNGNQINHRNDHQTNHKNDHQTNHQNDHQNNHQNDNLFESRISNENYQCLYNIQLCKGIVAMKQFNQQKAIEHFQKSIDYLMRPQPYFYISVILSQKNLKNGSSTQIFMKILSILQSGLSVSATAQMHYFRALIFIYLGMNSQALDDIDKAIQISEDNVVEHFYAKGIVFLLENNYQQAMAQFQVALSIEQKCQKTLLQKAKCQLLHDAADQAYLSLQLYRSLSIVADPYPWQLLFLLSQHKFQQILQIETLNQQHQQHSEIGQLLKQIKYKCYFYLGRFQECGPAGKIVMALIFQTFQGLLTLIDQALDIHVTIPPITHVCLKFIKAYVLFKLQKYDQTIQMYQEIEQILSINQNQQLDDQINFQILLVKLNIILSYWCQQKYQKCKQKISSLLIQIEEGQIQNDLKLMLIRISQIQLDKTCSLPNLSLFLFLNNQLLSSFLPIQTLNSISFRVLLPFPKLQIQQLQIDNEKLLREFRFEQIQNRPEAPWIRRGQFGVIFTSQIHEGNGLYLNTQETQNNQRHQRLVSDLRLASDVLLKLQKLTQIK